MVGGQRGGDPGSSESFPPPLLGHVISFTRIRVNPANISRETYPDMQSNRCPSRADAVFPSTPPRSLPYLSASRRNNPLDADLIYAYGVVWVVWLPFPWGSHH